ncbi:sensor histidine kinase [Zavarzinella formosa]|uniref:sensor histidine kinase n=1 Tax=Zavarzinella formosa TaxID=360055 RepID=UPI000308AE1E|nr:HAMP domain-containing sensor histidine kinase [Zavarzinella formosa]
MRLGIRYRLLVPLGLLLSGVVAASLWSAQVAARRAEERVAVQLRNVTLTLRNLKYPLTTPIIDQIKQLSGAEFLIVFPGDRRITTFAHDDVEVSPVDEIPEADGFSLGPPVIVEGEAYRVRGLVLKEPHKDAGTSIYVFYPESLLKEVIADAERPSFLGLIFGLVAVVFTFLLADRFVRRIRQLEKQTRGIARGDFSPMTVPTPDDELRDLVVSVNEMAARLAGFQSTVEKTERLRFAGQLASGLAHQLRNGVTGAQLALDIALSDLPNTDTEAIAVAKRQLTMMDVNLRRFIDLNRNEPPKMEPCDLAKITRESVELFLPQSRHANIILTLEIPEHPVMLTGNPAPLNDIVTNLVGNALDAVGQNGEVSVRVVVRDGFAAISIADSGPGPSPEIAVKLFEPFVTGKPEGIGLGLAVVRQAVTAHRGEISWGRENQHTVFRVTLPISSEAHASMK